MISGGGGRKFVRLFIQLLAKLSRWVMVGQKKFLIRVLAQYRVFSGVSTPAHGIIIVAKENTRHLVKSAKRCATVYHPRMLDILTRKICAHLSAKPPY